MTADDEIREAARMARFLATGDIQPRYDVRDVLGRGAHITPPTHLADMGGNNAGRVFPSLPSTHD
jgi:hypothetical protein